MFKKLLMPLFAAACLSPFMYADVSGSVGVDSDYFWRGVSQNDGNPSMNLNLEYQGNGFYAGTWIGQVDYGNEVKHENDFYAGYALALTDDMAIDVGLIQYKYDTLIEDSEEVYVGVSLNNFGMYHHVNLDNSDLTYTQMKYTLPFITQLDVSVGYALHSDEAAVMMGGMDDHFMVSVSKDLGNLTLSAMVMDGARHGDVMDNASVGLHYNF
jgi:uncharacterized protein (TIGR02001 family)